MRNHTGGMTSMGNRYLYSIPHKQKLNTNTSSETEFVARYDVMPQLLWENNSWRTMDTASGNIICTRKNERHVIEENGKVSSKNRTRHINIRYLFVKDRLNLGDVIIAHCPTEDM